MQMKLNHHRHNQRHEVNCLTKEEFERGSRLPLVRQNSQMHSPLTSSLSVNEVVKPSYPQQEVSAPGQADKIAYEKQMKQQQQENNHKPLATLMVQPSVDYGKCLRHQLASLSEGELETIKAEAEVGVKLFEFKLDLI